MPLSPSPDSEPEHSRRSQIRQYLHKFTTTIRRGSKDAADDNNIPQPDLSHETTHEHSHDETLFDFSNIIVAEEAPTTCESCEDPRPEPHRLNESETFLVDRDSIYQERAQKLRDRYGFNVDGQSQATFPPAARRVQKPARMRVHRSCHMCGIDFGHGIHCRACHHRMCSDCPRAPGRRIQDAMSQARQHPIQMYEAADASLKTVSTENTRPQIKPSPSSSMVHHPDENVLPMIEADDNVDCPTALITLTRQHHKDTRRMSIGPHSSRHDPYALSSAGDPILRAPAGVQRVYRKTRQRIRYTCHQCRSPFDKDGKTCPSCNHERCRECRDKGHSKGKGEPDPRLVEAVNRRLSEISR